MHVVDAREGELRTYFLSKRKIERHIPCGPISIRERAGVGEVGSCEHCLIVIRRGICQCIGGHSKGCFIRIWSGFDGAVSIGVI